MYKLLLLLLLIFLTSFEEVNAQAVHRKRYTLIIDHLKNPKHKKYLVEGELICIQVKSGESLTGRVNHINDSTFLVDNLPVKPSQIEYFQLPGVRSKSLQLVASLLIVPSIYFLIRGYAKFVVSSSLGNELKGLDELAIGVTGISSGFFILRKTSKKYVASEWRVRIKSI